LNYYLLAIILDAKKIVKMQI